MKNLLILLSILILAACGTADPVTENPENAGDGQDVNATSVFVTDASNLGTSDKTFENEEDIDVFLTAFGRGEFHDGPTTAEAPNYRVTVTYEDDTSEAYLLWLHHGNGGGRYQMDPASLDGVYILMDEDAEALGDLLAER